MQYVATPKSLVAYENTSGEGSIACTISHGLEDVDAGSFHQVRRGLHWHRPVPLQAVGGYPLRVVDYRNTNEIIQWRSYHRRALAWRASDGKGRNCVGASRERIIQSQGRTDERVEK